MAERRMFAKQIIDSDAFLDMPLSAQALYFHLSMRADDDGFINNPRKIQRMIGASDDDCKLLLMKRFLIAFESGVVVIKHWKIHNYIRGDRKKETVYTKEMAQLIEKDNGSYTLKAEIPAQLEAPEEDPKAETMRQKAYRESSLPYSFEYKIRSAFWGKPCPVCGCIMSNYSGDEYGADNRIPTIQHNIPISKGGKHELGNISVICRQCNVSIQDNETGDLNAAEVIEKWDKICMSGKCQSSDSQVPGNCPHRLGEDRIGKDSLGEFRAGEEKAPATHAPAPDVKAVIELYLSICTSLPPVKTLSATRKQNIETALQDFTLEDFRTCFKKAEASSFLKGQKKGGFKASFDWLIKVENMSKVIEGNYDDAPANANSSYEVNDFFRAAIDKSYAERTEANRNNPPQTAADDPELYERAQALKSQIG